MNNTFDCYFDGEYITHQSSATTETQDNRNDVYSAVAMTYSYPNTSTTLPDDDPFYPDIPPNPNPSHGCSTTLPFYPDVPNPNPGKSTTDTTTTTTLPVSDSPIPVRLIVLNKSELTLEMHQNVMLFAEVYPSNASDSSLNWNSSNPDVATTLCGLVFSKGIGTTTITASANDGSGVRACCKVTVVPGIPIISIKLEPTSKKMIIGESIKLFAKIQPDNASQKVLTWTSSNPDVATIDVFRKRVTAWKEGTAIIYAKANDDSGKISACEIEVQKSYPAKGITLYPEKIFFTHNNDTSISIQANIQPNYATDKSIIWKTSDPDIATVDQTGLVTPHQNGKTEIYAILKTNHHISKACKVWVDLRPMVKIIRIQSKLFEVHFAEYYDEDKTRWMDEKTWLNIGCDLSDPTIRSNRDIHNINDERLTPNEKRFAQNALQKFTEKQLAFLYLLDPLGVEFYVKNNYQCENGESLGDMLLFKDRLYHEIFGEMPNIIQINDDEVRRYDYPSGLSSKQRPNYCTDAEILFESHPIYDIQKLLEEILSKIFSDITGKIFSITIADINVTSLSKNAYKYMFYAGAMENDLQNGVFQSFDTFAWNTLLGETKINDLFDWINIFNDFLYKSNAAFKDYKASELDCLIFNRMNAEKNFNALFVAGGRETSIAEFLES